MTEARETKKHDGGKVRLELADPHAEHGLAMILTMGVAKYADHGWHDLRGERERILGALMRHLNAIRRGELVDPESGLPHSWHAHCNTMFLAAFDAWDISDAGLWDDLMAKFDRTVAEIREKYKEEVE